MFLAQVKANEIKREAVSEYKKEDEINELKEDMEAKTCIRTEVSIYKQGSEYKPDIEEFAEKDDEINKVEKIEGIIQIPDKIYRKYEEYCGLERTYKINELKKEVSSLLEKIKIFKNIVVEDAFLRDGQITAQVSSNGDLFLGKRYLDKEMGYYRTKMVKTIIDEMPECYKITLLEIQKLAMKDVLENFSDNKYLKKNK